MLFLESGVASVTAATRDGKQAEIGIIGFEGMIHIAVVMGKTSTPLEAFIQVPGSGHVVPAAKIAALTASSPHFRTLAMAFAHSFSIQVSRSLLAALTLTLDARLSRWLLLSSDRSRSDTFPMTHEFLSLMLGVRRAGVTDALNKLEATGLITTRRGEISILDRAGLKARAGELYLAEERSFLNLYA